MVLAVVSVDYDLFRGLQSPVCTSAFIVFEIDCRASLTPFCSSLTIVVLLLLCHYSSLTIADYCVCVSFIRTL